MHLKRYEVVDMREAISQIKRDLGPDAIILSTRKIRKRRGTFSLLGQPLYEVMAAADPQGPHTPSTLQTPSPLMGEGSGGGGKGRLPSASELDFLREEVQRMRGELHALQGIVGEGRWPASLKDRHHPKSLKELDQQLVSRGVAGDVADQLLAEVREGGFAGAPGEESTLEEALKRVMIQRVKALEPQAAGERAPHCMAFVGPTGVGKTTTIAKLAAASALLQQKRVALLTLDTYRIAAVEQLKVYAQIIGTPLTVAVDGEELGRALRQTQGLDVILIDTPGRCYRDAEQMWELTSLLSQRWPIETHLVLSATTREEEADEIFRRFSHIPIHSLLFTKLDESGSLGSLFNLAVRTAKPLSYLTTGQRVPEDIEVATPEKIVDVVLHGLWR